MCRVAAQAMTRPSAPSWLAKMPWFAALAPPGSELGDESATERKENDYLYQYSTEHNACIRKKPKGRMEFSEPLDVEKIKALDDGASIEASFPDGVVTKVPGITAGMIKAILARAATNSPGEIWSGMRADTKHRVTIRQRTDRVLLVSIYDQNRQICQVRADWWCPTLTENTMIPNDHEAIVGAKSLLIPIAEKYCRMEISKDEIMAERDARLKEKGLPPPRPPRVTQNGVNKRPAASPQHERRQKKSKMDRNDAGVEEEAPQPTPVVAQPAAQKPPPSTTTPAPENGKPSPPAAANPDRRNSPNAWDHQMLAKALMRARRMSQPTVTRDPPSDGPHQSSWTMPAFSRSRLDALLAFNEKA